MSEHQNVVKLVPLELVPVELMIDGEKYSTFLSNQEIEEIAADPEKYNNLCEKIMKDKKSKTSTKFSWTNEATKLLLNLRLGRDAKFNRPQCKKNKLWQEIAADMLEIGHYNVTMDECHIKYRNLLQTYKNNKTKKLKTTGEGKITWEFYEQFDEVLGSKASSCPSQSLLSSSIEASCEYDGDANMSPATSPTSCLVDTQTSSAIEVEEDDSDDDVARSSRTTKKRKLKRVKDEMTIGKYLFLKASKDERKWNEKKQLKEKEIEAFNNLANAIRESIASKPRKRRLSENESETSETD